MKLRRVLEFVFLNPNSKQGLIIRAENLEEKAEKIDGQRREGFILYARALRKIASRNWTPAQNRAWIDENLRVHI